MKDKDSVITINDRFEWVKTISNFLSLSRSNRNAMMKCILFAVEPGGVGLSRP
jgi:hypothetical protein